MMKLFFLTIPFSTLLTSIAVLLPYWWSSETFQIGLWRARYLSSSWIVIEPQLETSEGRLLFLLQLLSFFSVFFADLQGLLWFIVLLRSRHSSVSLRSLLVLFLSSIMTYFLLSSVIFLVWKTTRNYLHLIRISYSFYLVLLIIVIHSLTLISLIINLIQYRSNRRTIQPCEKVLPAFNQAII